MATLSTLNMLMKSDKNYREYREAFRVVAPPCVPFLGESLLLISVGTALTTHDAQVST
jgi:hypothetical protein